MRFIIHVICESSQHKQNELGNYEIQYAKAETDEFCDVFRTDCFYVVDDADNENEALIKVAHKIKLRDKFGDIAPLSKILMDSYNEMQGDDELSAIKEHGLVYENKGNSTLTITKAIVDRVDESDSWIEFHRIFFFIVSPERIVRIR